MNARARRRLWTIAMVYALHFFVALAIAWPQSGLLADRTSSLPGGDRALFEPGGLYLLEAFRLSYRSMSSAARGDLWLVVLAMVLGLLPLGALVTALDRSGPVRLRDLLSGAGACFGRYAILFGLSLLAAGFGATLCLLVGGALGASPLELPYTRSDLAGIVVVYSVLAVLLAVLGVLHDLARASVVRHDADIWSAIARAGAALRARPVALLGGWAVRAGMGGLLVASSLALGSVVSIATSRGFLAIAFVDQLVAFSLVALRASWLALALRTLDEPQPSSSS